MTGRRKGRHICGWIMSAAMAFAVWGLIAAGIFDKGIYNTSLLNESVSASSFLDQRYDGFEAEVQEALRAVNLPEELLGREELYERFSLDLKKKILGNEAGEPEEWLKQLAEDTVEEYLDSRDEFIFTTYGYGHGVGMSQTGAMLMAAEGADYVEILEHYFPGTTVR